MALGALRLGAGLTRLCHYIVAATSYPTQFPAQIHPSQDRKPGAFSHWANRDLALLFLTAFLSMGTFVSMYNFLTFRLIDDFGLAPSLAGLAFVLPHRHMVLSAGRFPCRTHRPWENPIRLCRAFALGIALCAGNLPLTLLGMIAFTVGFSPYTPPPPGGWARSPPTTARRLLRCMCSAITLALLWWAHVPACFSTPYRGPSSLPSSPP